MLPSLFIPVVLAAAAVDVTVLNWLATPGPRRSGRSSPQSRVAAVVRVGAHRSLLFRVVRREQDAPAHRAPAPGVVRLSVVVPAFGEEERIGTTVARLRAELHDVGGGRRDHCCRRRISRRHGGRSSHCRSRPGARAAAKPGQGRRRARRHARSAGRTVVFTDADLAYAPAQIVNLLDRIESGWDVVVGNRRHVATSTLVRAPGASRDRRSAREPGDARVAARPVPRYPVRAQRLQIGCGAADLLHDAISMASRSMSRSSILLSATGCRWPRSQ